MADDLEPTEVVVPEQKEMFRQGSAPTPEPEPVAAAPEPEPVAPEPEPPPVEPDWLSAPAEPGPAPQYQEPQYQYQQPQYPQQPQVPQGTNADAALQGFVDNPDGWLNQKLAQRDQQLVGPLAQQQQQVAYMMNTLVENQVSQGVAQVDAAIRKAYDGFNKDASFRSNKGMQNKIHATLDGMKKNAVMAARNGSFGPMNSLINLSESDISGTLGYLKGAMGIPSPGTGPLQVEGAALESARSTVAQQSVELDADTEAAIKRLGPAYRDRLIKAKIAANEADDFEG